MSPANPQRFAEQRSLAFHRAVADRIRTDPSLIAAARQRIGRWLASGAMAPAYADAWVAILAKPIAQLCDDIVDASERGRALRQCSPFAGALDPRTRWRIHRAVRAGRVE